MVTLTEVAEVMSMVEAEVAAVAGVAAATQFATTDGGKDGDAGAAATKFAAFRDGDDDCGRPSLMVSEMEHKNALEGKQPLFSQQLDIQTRSNKASKDGARSAVPNALLGVIS